MERVPLFPRINALVAFGVTHLKEDTKKAKSNIVFHSPFREVDAEVNNLKATHYTCQGRWLLGTAVSQKPSRGQQKDGCLVFEMWVVRERKRLPIRQPGSYFACGPL